VKTVGGLAGDSLRYLEREFHLCGNPKISWGTVSADLQPVPRGEVLKPIREPGEEQVQLLLDASIHYLIFTLA
jgi:hypothetical protein